MSEQVNENEEVGRHYSADTDLNENGIPDSQERDFSMEFDERVHQNNPAGRDDRVDREMLAATYDLDGSNDNRRAIDGATAEIAKIQDESERLPHQTEYSSGELQKRIEKIRKKRIPKSSFAKELSRMPPNKSDAENGLEMGKHAYKGLIHGLMSSHKDAENARDARLAAELEEARDAQKQLDKQTAEAAKAEDSARAVGASKDEDREDGSGGATGTGGEGPGAEGTGTPTAGNNGPSGPGSAGATVSAGVDRAQAIGEAGLGLAAATVDPTGGIALTAANAYLNQRGSSNQQSNMPTTPSISSVADVVQRIENQRKQTLGVATGSPQAANCNPLAAPPPAKGVETAKTGLLAQAAALPRPAVPTLSKGPSNPAPRPRAQGLGFGMSGFMKAVRSLAPANEISVAAWMQKERDSGGMGR